jgi:hypothetical protein
MAKTPQFLSSIWEKLSGLLVSLKQGILSLWKRAFKSKAVESPTTSRSERVVPVSVLKTDSVENPKHQPSSRKRIEITVLAGGAEGQKKTINILAQEGESVCKLLQTIMTENQRTHLFDIESISDLYLIYHGRGLPADEIVKASHFDGNAKLHLIVSNPLDVFNNAHQGLDIVLGKKGGEKCILLYNMAHKLLGYKLPHPKLNKISNFKCTPQACAQQLEQYAEIIPAADPKLNYAFKTLAVALKERFPPNKPKMSRKS